MSIRSDVTINWEQTPRLVEIALGSSEFSAQDSGDTIRSLEHSPAPGFDVFSHEYLVDLTGKQDLGAGVSVGITLTYRDGQVAFSRTSSRSSGTATTGSSTQLIDSAADFVTDGVQRGDWIINFTDQSVTEVLEVVDLNTLNVRPLSDGTDNDFDIGDAYKVWEVAECELGGGNHVAVDSVGSTINPLFTTFGRFAARTSSSSATLQELSSIQFASFNGAVTIDVANISGNAASGTTFPTGTLEQPSDNLTDAAAIAATRGLSEIDALGDLTVSSGTWDNFQFVGQSRTASTITVNAAASVIGAEFRNATVQGTLDDDVTLTDCSLVNLTDMNGVIERCLLTGTITLGGSKNTEILDSWGGFDIGFTPVIDMGGSGQGLAARRFTGSIQLENKTGSEEVVVEFGTGHLTLAATYGGAGFMTARGSGRLTNLGATSPLDVSYFVRGERITDIWRRDGLDPQRPVAIDTDGLTAPLLEQTYTVNPDGSVTVTRTV